MILSPLLNSSAISLLAGKRVHCVGRGVGRQRQPVATYVGGHRRQWGEALRAAARTAGSGAAAQVSPILANVMHCSAHRLHTQWTLDPISSKSESVLDLTLSLLLRLPLINPLSPPHQGFDLHRQQWRYRPVLPRPMKLIPLSPVTHQGFDLPRQPRYRPVLPRPEAHPLHRGAPAGPQARALPMHPADASQCTSVSERCRPSGFLIGSSSSSRASRGSSPKHHHPPGSAAGAMYAGILQGHMLQAGRYDHMCTRVCSIDL